ncbi:unnamed protein product [Echinostoma caproni]|uniref:Phospholipase B-like n=1 Tax=Echinostoma caproni TaxID=27848 RepID=A0A183AM19_9TREM|nr:unnamed protein product [Echinostoma caproni]
MQKYVDVKFDGDVITVTMVDQMLDVKWRSWQLTYTGGYFADAEKALRYGYWLHNLMKLMQHNTRFILGTEKSPIYMYDLTANDSTVDRSKENEDRSEAPLNKLAHDEIVSQLRNDGNDRVKNSVIAEIQNGAIKLTVSANGISQRWSQWKREQARQYTDEAEEKRRYGCWINQFLVALETELEYYLLLSNYAKSLNQFSDFGPNDHPIGCVVGCEADLGEQAVSIVG